MFDATDQLDPTAAEGGWKLLCATLLLNAVTRAKGTPIKRHVGRSLANDMELCILIEQSDAANWVNGVASAVTFEECCEAVSLDVSRVRRILADEVQHAKAQTGKPFTEIDAR